MTFAWPHLLWLLVVPALLLWWALTHRLRSRVSAHSKILRAEAGVRSLKLSAFNTQAVTTTPPRVWLCVGLALGIVALSRPQWGRVEEPVFDQSREILLAIDLSRSMLSQDVRPSRLDRAKLLIQSLLERLAGERVGLVVFSGTAFLQSPLSADYEILREFLPSMGPDFLPEGGTNYGALLEAALQAFGASNAADRFLIVLSDGEATDEDWRSRVAELKSKGIRILALGVGTAAGAMIPDGSGGLVKDERGAVVLSKLESATLQELAKETNGVYRDASGWVDLAALVKQTVEAGRKGEFLEKNTVRQVERFQWPLAFALWCLFVSLWYEFPVRPRVRDLKLAQPGAPESAKPAPAAAAKAAALLMLLGIAFAASNSVWAAATVAPFKGTGTGSSTPAAGATAADAAPPEPPALARIVGRLSAADARTAHDWAELGRETVSWGSRIKSEQQPVPEGPVRDALSAVDIGSKLDAKATDWPKLREELEALLEKPEEEKQKQQQQQNQDQQQQQDQSKQEKQNQQDQNSSSQQSKDPQKAEDQAEKDSSSAKQPEKKEPKEDPGESAFGDMNKKEQPPPPPPQSTQKVGGAQEKKEEPQEAQDPALALPRQKLEQLRDQDSPARLFQLMDGKKKQPTKKPSKDW